MLRLFVLLVLISLSVSGQFGEWCNGEHCDYDKKCINYPSGPKCGNRLEGEGNFPPLRRTRPKRHNEDIVCDSTPCAKGKCVPGNGDEPSRCV
ncbi:unnamed protein product, partial [Mesorhabditis belari]|uniref:Uncharacterized protein n=1 Tax=Mesorhabditis belari TaxID=2138241 RepID=A0AAF3EV18_9BILA